MLRGSQDDFTEIPGSVILRAPHRWASCLCYVNGWPPESLECYVRGVRSLLIIPCCQVDPTHGRIKGIVERFIEPMLGTSIVTERYLFPDLYEYWPNGWRPSRYDHDPGLDEPTFHCNVIKHAAICASKACYYIDLRAAVRMFPRCFCAGCGEKYRPSRHDKAMWITERIDGRCLAWCLWTCRRDNRTRVRTSIRHAVREEYRRQVLEPRMEARQARLALAKARSYLKGLMTV